MSSVLWSFYSMHSYYKKALSSGVVTSIPITFMENWGKGDMETWCWITYHPLQNRTLNLCVFNDIAFGEGTLILSVETKTRGYTMAVNEKPSSWCWLQSNGEALKIFTFLALLGAAGESFKEHFTNYLSYIQIWALWVEKQ